MQILVVTAGIVVDVKRGKAVSEHGHILPSAGQALLMSNIPAEADCRVILVALHDVSKIGDLALILKGDADAFVPCRLHEQINP